MDVSAVKRIHPFLYIIRHFSHLTHIQSETFVRKRIEVSSFCANTNSKGGKHIFCVCLLEIHTFFVPTSLMFTFSLCLHHSFLLPFLFENQLLGTMSRILKKL